VNQCHRVAIALGSNLGDSFRILEGALRVLAETPGIQVQAQSPVYQTVAVGPPQPDYLNACALLLTRLDPESLLSVLLSVEAEFGRVRRERWGARRLDIDLLLFDDLILRQSALEIPHPRMAQRAFVLVPLNDIAAAWVEPVSEQTIAELVQQVDCSGVKPMNRSLSRSTIR
jgi:2-amino-4-hydroxy-6-hydroxymethyldihydropteridine diphosphokinase